MIRSAILSLLLVGTLHAAAAEPRTTPELGIRHRDSRYLALTHGRIVVAPGRELTDATLVIRDGRVVEVGEGLPVPPGAHELDLGGKTVFPGFIDPYTEYGLQEVGPLNPPTDDDEPKYEATRRGGEAWNDAIHAHREWVEAFVPHRESAEAFLERGVTVVQSAKQDGIFRGRAFSVSLATGLPGDVVLRSRGPQVASFHKGSSRQSYPTSLMGSIALIRQTLLDAAWYEQAHAAYARNTDQALPEFNQAVEALAANDGSFLFASRDVLSLLRASRIAAEFSLSLTYLGSNREYERLEDVAALDAVVILPLEFPEAPDVTTVDAQLDVTLAELRHWERAPHNAAALERAGVRFAFTGHGLAGKKDGNETFLKNVRKTVRRGLARDTALAALTVVPAEIAGVAEEVGTLERGRLANFFIADGDVLTEPAEILSVWIEGRRELLKRELGQVDFRGVYELQLDGRKLELSVRGKPGSPRPRLAAGDESAQAEGVRLEPATLRFYARTDALGIDGAVRFRLLARDGGFEGQAWMPDGERVEVAVRKVAERAPKVRDASKSRRGPAGDDEGEGADDEEAEAPEALALVSRLTSPNVAFGFDGSPRAEDLLVRGATIWTSGPRGVLAGADLKVAGGKIVAVGNDLAAGGARVIDARGKHVTPGMIDEHAHLAISRGVNEGSHSVTAEVRIGDVVNPDDIAIYRALAGGTTTAQLLHGSANSIGGQAQIVKLRWGSGPEQLKLAGAPLSIKFALGENVKQSNWGDQNKTRYPQTRMGVETLLRDAFNAALAYERAWDDHEALGARERAAAVPPRRDLQMETLLEILRSRRFVHCHSYVQSEVLMLMRLAEEYGFRIGTFTHILEGYKVASEMAAHGAGASTFSDWWAYKFEVYDAIPYNTCILHDRGVVTSINSDSNEVIRRLNQEAAKSVMYCGMAEPEALKLATLNPAIQLEIDDRVGSLEPGKDADFVVWSGNPLSMFSKVEQTWIEGARYFDLETDAALRQDVQGEKQRLVQKVLVHGKSESGSAREGRHRRRPGAGWTCEDVNDVWKDRVSP